MSFFFKGGCVSVQGRFDRVFGFRIRNRHCAVYAPNTPSTSRAQLLSSAARTRKPAVFRGSCQRSPHTPLPCAAGETTHADGGHPLLASATRSRLRPAATTRLAVLALVLLGLAVLAPTKPKDSESFGGSSAWLRADGPTGTQDRCRRRSIRIAQARHCPPRRLLRGRLPCLPRPLPAPPGLCGCTQCVGGCGQAPTPAGTVGEEPGADGEAAEGKGRFHHARHCPAFHHRPGRPECGRQGGRGCGSRHTCYLLVLPDVTDKDAGEPTSRSSTTLKVLHSMAYATNHYTFDFYARVGDDAYLRVDYLAELILVDHAFPLQQAYIGYKFGDHRIPGSHSTHNFIVGMGFFLSQDLTQYVCRAQDVLLDGFPEDGIVGSWFVGTKVDVIHEPRFHDIDHVTTVAYAPCSNTSLLLHHMWKRSDWEAIDGEGLMQC